MMAVGLLALTHATTWPLLMLFAVGVGVGFGLTVLAVSILLLNYYGRKNNLEIFSLVCLVGAVSALGPGDRRRDARPPGQLRANLPGVRGHNRRNLHRRLLHAPAAQGHPSRAGRRTGP
jgi:hypothetical protein